MRLAYRPLRIALWATVAVGVGIVVAGSVGWAPPAEYEQAIGEVSRWCERVSAGLFREPVNTLGNLGFVVSGLAMFFVLGRDVSTGTERINRFVGQKPISLLYASAVLFLGPGSMLMHGSHTRFGAWVDNVSMVAFILIPWLFNVASLGRWRDRTFFLSYAAVLAAYGLGYWFFGSDLGIGLDLFGLSIALWAISEFLYRAWTPVMRWASGLLGFAVAGVFGITPGVMLASPGDYWWVVLFWLPAILATNPAPGRRRYLPWYWVGVGSFLVAYAIWLTGTPDHPACNPDSLIQAHAGWHLLTALATWSFFKFFRTETAIEHSAPASTSV
jgi:hypothetical protein